MIYISIPSDDVIINALNHEIRREILRLLNKGSMSYSQLMENFAIASGKLNYHLKLLTGFVEKKDDGSYQITILGTKLIQLLEDFHSLIKEEDKQLIKKAYITQLEGEKSYLHLQIVGGLQMKVILVAAIFTLIIIMIVMYSNAGVDISKIWPFLAIAIPIFIVGLIWVYRMYGPAKKFAEKVERFLKESES